MAMESYHILLKYVIEYPNSIHGDILYNGTCLKLVVVYKLCTKKVGYHMR